MGRLELKAAVRAVAAATDGRTTQLSLEAQGLLPNGHPCPPHRTKRSAKGKEKTRPSCILLFPE